jgi:hypothetical protein
MIAPSSILKRSSDVLCCGRRSTVIDEPELGHQLVYVRYWEVHVGLSRQILGHLFPCERKARQHERDSRHD